MNDYEKLMQVNSLAQEAQKSEMDWFRHLLTLAAGALVLMATLGPTTSVMGLLQNAYEFKWYERFLS